MYVLVTYDVETMTSDGQRRLRQVARQCLNYGQRVQIRLCKLNCVMLYSHSISSVGERPAPRGGTTRPDERKITTI